MNRLVLIDGNAILHRAYHALPPLTAPDGTFVNAVYGFTSMLLKITADLKPTHIAVAFDRPAPTFRKELFGGYQAKRPKMDDELVGQIEKVHEVVRAFDIPIFEQDGFEADDVIGTLSKAAPEHGIDQVIIVTGDRDLLQLVDDHTYIYMLVKGLTQAQLYDEKEVKEKIGVTPEQVIDYKALAGDASDNYPGVAGIGPKTAVELVQKFGTVEKLYASVHANKTHDIAPAILEKLKTGEADAVMSKDLATVRREVPIDGGIVLRSIMTLNTPKAAAALGVFGFHSLVKRLTGQTAKREKSTKKEVPKEEKKAGEQQQLF